MNQMTQANRVGWDGLAATHYRNYHVDRLLAGEPLLNDVIRGEVGMRIEFLHEFPQYFYNGYTPHDVENDRVELYPCTFSLKAVAI